MKVAYLHYYMVLEQIVVLLVDLGLGFIFAPLLPIELEILAPSYAIFNAPTHMISTPTWEGFVDLD